MAPKRQFRQQKMHWYSLGTELVYFEDTILAARFRPCMVG
jgi:hypothetical protein